MDDDNLLRRVRALRDSCQNATTLQSVTPAQIEELWAFAMRSAQPKLARASAQCVANLAAAGLRSEVWAAVVARAAEFEAALESKSCRAALLAAAYNGFCRDAERAQELARASLLPALVRHSGEWPYLIACALFRLGAARAALENREARERLLELALAAVNSEPDAAFGDQDDVSIVALDYTCGDLAGLALEVVADATGGAAASKRAPALRSAGACAVAGAALDDYPLLALRIIANICHFDAPARDEARALIPAVLSRCKVDPNTPLLREWAVFAVRNVCHDNDENRRYIASLQPKAVDTSSVDLRAVGVENVDLTTDPATGKNELRVTRRAASKAR